MAMGFSRCVASLQHFSAQRPMFSRRKLAHSNLQSANHAAELTRPTFVMISPRFPHVF
jgi:hypothetical protein